MLKSTQLGMEPRTPEGGQATSAWVVVVLGKEVPATMEKESVEVVC